MAKETHHITGSGSDHHTHSNDHYLNRQASMESNARSYPRHFPLAIKKALGSWIEDVEGNRYLDALAGAGTLALGHNHPRIINKIKEVLDSGLPLHTLDITTPVKDRFTEMLLGKLPSALQGKARMQFCGPTGSDAAEAAIKLCKIATGRENIISFQGGYHGMGHGSLSMTGNLNSKGLVGGLMPYVHSFPYPYSYRCPFGLGGDAGTRTAGYYFEHVLKDPESGIPKPAAVILESIQGEGGVIPAPVEWLKTVRRVTKELGIPLIIDEIQSGVGRSGKFFAYEYADIVPDVVLVSKAIGGSLPLAVVMYNEELDVWKPGHHAGTFRGNQMAMAAGTEVMVVLEEEGLMQQASEKGKRIQEHFLDLQKRTSIIGDVRGKGLMKGVELIDPTAEADQLGSRIGSNAISSEVQKICFENKLIIEKGGRHGAVMRFIPALTITNSEIDQMMDIFEKAILTVDKKYA